MAKTYAQLLKQGIDELLEISSSLKTQGPSMSKVRRLKYLSGFLGLQKLSDLGFWLEDWLDSAGPKTSPMDEGIRSHFCTLVNEVLLQVEPPLEFGEFVNPEGIALRPLFRKEVPVHQLFSQLKDIHPIQFHKRNIFKLPVSVQEAYPYSLRLPARFLEKADLDSYLVLLYVDLGRSAREDWRTYADVLHRLVQEQIILYQGAMEVSWDFLRSRKPLLPYYLLYSGAEDPREFLKSAGFSGHVMRMLKRPGEPWSSQGQTLEEGEEEFWDIYDLESGEMAPRKIQKTGGGLLAVAEKFRESGLPAHNSTAGISPGVTSEDGSLSVDTSPEADTVPAFSSLSPDHTMAVEPPAERDPELNVREESGAPETGAANRNTGPVWSPEGSRLAEIPFTLEALEDPKYPWPQGIDEVDLITRMPPEPAGTDGTAGAMAAPVSSPEKVEAPSASGLPVPQEAPPPSQEPWIPEIRTPDWTDTLEDLKDNQMKHKNSSLGVISALTGIAALAFMVSTAYLVHVLVQKDIRNAFRRGTESAQLYGQVLDRAFIQARTAGGLFRPSVDGMEPETVSLDFYELFYPPSLGVSGFGFKKEEEGWSIFSSRELPQSLESYLDSQSGSPAVPEGRVLPLAPGGGLGLWTLDAEKNARIMWVFSWDQILLPPADGQGLLILNAYGEELYRAGNLWEKYEGFTLPLSSFLPGVERGPLNYQDIQGRQVWGGYARTPQGLMVCVMEGSLTPAEHLQLPEGL